MGDGTPLTINRDTVRRSTDRSIPIMSLRHPTRLGIDVPLLLIVSLLLVFGLLMLYSASTDYSLFFYGDPIYQFSRQLIWAGLSIGVAIGLGWLNYRIWLKLVLPAMLITIVGLVGVLLLSIVSINYKRWLFGGSVQPSEAAKVILIIYLAVWLYNKREQIRDLNFGLIPLSTILGILGGLILLQDDLSATVIIFILGGLMFFLAGGDSRQIVIFLVVALIVGAIVFQFYPKGRTRMEEYRAGLQDITKAPEQLSRALEAIVKGGWFGVGIGRSETKLTGLSLAPTDSIFAVVAEETGIFGSASLAVLYILLMWRGLVIAQRAPDSLGKLLASGLSIWITLEALINMTVLVGLAPFAGTALPFVSYGGSSLITMFAGIGIIFSVSRQSAKKREAEERTFDAVVDLRRRDGGRHLPRSRRSSTFEKR